MLFDNNATVAAVPTNYETPVNAQELERQLGMKMQEELKLTQGQMDKIGILLQEYLELKSIGKGWSREEIDSLLKT